MAGTVLHQIVEIPLPAVVGQEVDLDAAAPESSPLGIWQQCLGEESRLRIADNQKIRVFSCQVFHGVHARLLKCPDLQGGALGVVDREAVEGELLHAQFQTHLVQLESWLKA